MDGYPASVSDASRCLRLKQACLNIVYFDREVGRHGTSEDNSRYVGCHYARSGATSCTTVEDTDAAAANTGLLASAYVYECTCIYVHACNKHICLYCVCVWGRGLLLACLLACENL